MSMPQKFVQGTLLVFAGIFASAVEAQVLIEEITVTAQKKSQNLQKVGVSVTAFTAEQIERIAKTEPTLRDMLQQFRHLFERVRTGESGSVVAAIGHALVL